MESKETVLGTPKTKAHIAGGTLPNGMVWLLNISALCTSS